MPFCLRDALPVIVVSNWAPDEVQRHDNRRKELGDAAGFARHIAANRLMGDAGFRAALCAGRITWVLAKIDAARRYPFLDAIKPIATDRDSAVWHIDASSPPRSAENCGVPSSSMASAQAR